jgi:hypothetical protein
MKRIALLFLFVAGAAVLSQAQGSFKGTVVRMRMTECVAQRGFMAAMSGTAPQPGTTCPEYTVMSDKVVYVVVGRHTGEFIPLAENMDFLVRKNELVIFSDDEKTKSRFVIESMSLRTGWDREEARRDLALRIAEHMRYDSGTTPPGAMTSNAGGIQ